MRIRRSAISLPQARFRNLGRLGISKFSSPSDADAWDQRLLHLLNQKDLKGIATLHREQRGAFTYFFINFRAHCRDIGEREISRRVIGILDLISENLLVGINLNEESVVDDMVECLKYARSFLVTVTLADAVIPLKVRLLRETFERLGASIAPIQRIFFALDSLLETAVPATAESRIGFMALSKTLERIQQGSDRDASAHVARYLASPLPKGQQVPSFLADFSQVFFDGFSARVKGFSAIPLRPLHSENVCCASLGHFAGLLMKSDRRALDLLQQNASVFSEPGPNLLPLVYLQHFWSSISDSIFVELRLGLWPSQVLEVFTVLLRSFLISGEVPRLYIWDKFFEPSHGTDVNLLADNLYNAAILHLLAHRLMPDEDIFRATPRLMTYPEEDEVLVRLALAYRLPNKKPAFQGAIASLVRFGFNVQGANDLERYRKVMDEIFHDPAFELPDV